MTTSPWTPLQKIQLILDSEAWETIAPKVDSLVSAGVETLADVIHTATASTLEQGMTQARAALETLRANAVIEENSPSFAAGRIATMVDVLGYAAHQTADESELAFARQHPFAKLLDLLAECPARSTDLEAATGHNKGYISRSLSRLREAGLVSSLKQGRELFSALTPVGKLIVEQGIEEGNRAALSTSNVHAMVAPIGRRFSLEGREGPGNVTRTAPALLSANAR